ncbi:RING/FYVE/PHD zinc finger superfamily protein [Thalictrum thalictroides]|uniref:RING/FYVE/PHD zinc finger superfamily protein n=1 Tax=Thalictrum thalictroides TaxID=46969 RepID=A0A7J6VN84_THATH|nr:RING/FYVE/PHD zinc finger superfamily protein [Thalictrum thalictroides]
MGDNVVLIIDHDIVPASSQPALGDETSKYTGDGSSSSTTLLSKVGNNGTVEFEIPDEEEPLISAVECRICQEEDSIKNLETPCACSGSLKFAHRKCVQRWCNEKGDTTCEICHEPYKPGYTAPPPLPQDTAIDISEGWTISGTPLDLNDPRLLAMAAAERHFMEAEYDEYAATNASGAAFCRSAALILMALLLLRHALNITNTDGDGEDDASTFFSLFLLRAAGFLLPCYIMAWAISILQRRRQLREEAARLAATEVAFLLQSGQRGGLQFTIAPAPAPIPRQEPV